ncbi:type I restriction enzyme S subunit [Massilia sp. UYP32]|uniref:restriction endonuclease subunit S n=1 Tax=Massilia sp. UYP32 TaxID=1756386 RepID=UPI003D235315
MTVRKYQKYKESGSPWLPRVPEQWNVSPLLSVANERTESNIGMLENNLLSLSYGRIVRKDIDSNNGLLPESFETYQIVRPGDIVLRLTDLQNDKRSLRSAIVQEQGIITSAYLALQPRGIEPRFLAYLLRAYDLTKVFYSMGGGLRQSMKYADLKRMPVVLPSKIEQTAIAAFLDRETAKIDTLIAEQKKLIVLLDEKRLTTISHVVTRGLNPNTPMNNAGVTWLGEVPAHWKIMQLRHLADVLRGRFSHRPRNDPAFYDGDFPFVQTGDITSAGRYIQNFKQTLNERGAAVSKEFPAGTLVMAIAANIGDVAILDFPAYFPDSIVGMVPKSDIELQFLYYMLIAMKPPMLQTATVSTQMNLNVDQITSLYAVCPPIPEQKKIYEFLNAELAKIETLATTAEQGIALLQERRCALISAAVTGQIDVRDALEEATAEPLGTGDEGLCVHAPADLTQAQALLERNYAEN